MARKGLLWTTSKPHEVALGYYTLMNVGYGAYDAEV